MSSRPSEAMRHRKKRKESKQSLLPTAEPSLHPRKGTSLPDPLHDYLHVLLGGDSFSSLKREARRDGEPKIILGKVYKV